MKKLTQFLIPLGLGIAAFVMNWMAVQPQLGHDFVIVSAPVEADQPLKESNLAKFKIVGDDFTRLKQTLVPWNERAALVGLPMQRRLQTGDFVFWQDVRYFSADFLTEPDEIPLHVSLEGVEYEPNLLKVGNQVGLIVPVAPVKPAAAAATAGTAEPAAPPAAQYEELGPFRILSIGLRTESAPNEDLKPAAQRGNVRILTLAMKTDAPRTESATPTARAIPAAAQKLLNAQSARRADGKAIVAMVLYQDIAKLRRLREAAAADGPAPAGTATPAATATTTKSTTEEPKKP